MDVHRSPGCNEGTAGAGGVRRTAPRGADPGGGSVRGQSFAAARHVTGPLLLFSHQVGPPRCDVASSAGRGRSPHPGRALRSTTVSTARRSTTVLSAPPRRTSHATEAELSLPATLTHRSNGQRPPSSGSPDRTRRPRPWRASSTTSLHRQAPAGAGWYGHRLAWATGLPGRQVRLAAGQTASRRSVSGSRERPTARGPRHRRGREPP